MSCASFSSARPAIRRACSSEVRVLLVLRSSAWSVARVLGVSNGRGPADAIARLSPMTTDQKGAIAEACIAAQAIKLGAGVFRPLADERYDLIFDLRPALLRVQCKWVSLRRGVLTVFCVSSRRAQEGFRRRTYSAEEVDAIAAYSLELDRCFLIPIALVADRPSIGLRVEPSRNNQRQRINWADDFDLAATLRRLRGAVAQLGERRAGSA
jgi:PD-(D/E)XK nuclease superfamily protein